MTAAFKPGDCVIYRKLKLSAHPGRNAVGIWPAPCGDSYSYCVEKYYRVLVVQPRESIDARTVSYTQDRKLLTSFQRNENRGSPARRLVETLSR